MIKYWLSAFRLHTLPLSISGILMGNLAVYAQFSSQSSITNRFLVIAILSVLTGILLQILSNLANDYGDFVHGADSDKRIGPKRTVQSGAISANLMKKAIVTFIILSLISGSALLLVSLKNTGILPVLIFFFIGIAAIWAAYSYTAAKKPFGYKGWGDFFVFVFFGLAAVWGTYYLQTGNISLIVLLPACAIGCFSSAVLNLNNIRDIQNDKESGKITIAVRLGEKGAKWYHFGLLITGCILMIIFNRLIFTTVLQYIVSLAFLCLLILNGALVLWNKNPQKYYPLLKQLSVSVLINVLAFGGCILVLWRFVCVS